MVAREKYLEWNKDVDLGELQMFRAAGQGGDGKIRYDVIEYFTGKMVGQSREISLQQFEAQLELIEPL